MKTLKTLLMLAVLFLASCESTDPEGKWDSMIWKADVAVQKTDGFYQVPAAGAELIFSCQNYSFPWISDAESNGEYFFPPREENDFHTITTDWFRAEAKGNKLHVKFVAECGDALLDVFRLDFKVFFVVEPVVHKIRMMM